MRGCSCCVPGLDPVLCNETEFVMSFGALGPVTKSRIKLEDASLAFQRAPNWRFRDEHGSHGREATLLHWCTAGQLAHCPPSYRSPVRAPIVASRNSVAPPPLPS